MPAGFKQLVRSCRYLQLSYFRLFNEDPEPRHAHKTSVSTSKPCRPLY